MRFNFEFAEKVSIVYSNLCKPVYEKYCIGRTGLDILLFLANNPQYTNARDIVEIRHLKANLVSIHVDKLVKEGYLERKPIANDRRKRSGSRDSYYFSLFTISKQHLFRCILKRIHHNL